MSKAILWITAVCSILPSIVGLLWLIAALAFGWSTIWAEIVLGLGFCVGIILSIISIILLVLDKD